MAEFSGGAAGTAGRALLVVDVQGEYVTGRLPIEYPPLVQSLPNIGHAMDAANKAGIPVVVVQQSDPRPEASLFARGSTGWTLDETVSGRPFHHLVEKSLPSAFAGTDLDDWLRGRGIATITIVGYMTQNCVHATVNQAMHLGYRVEVLIDGTGTVGLRNSAGTVSAEEVHRVFTVVMQSRFAAVMTTDTWQEGLKTGIFPDRDTIESSHLSAAAREPR